MNTALDVAVQASLSENLGGSIEALLMECPTVATRVGGLVDSVIDGETGILVGAADSEELARGIIALLRDRSAARTLGQRGRQLMLDRFTLRKTVEDEDRLYRRLLAQAPAGYRPFRRALRLVVGAAVGVYLASRYRLLDGYLLPAWDAGWRPWHFNGIRRLLLGVVNRMLRLRKAVPGSKAARRPKAAHRPAAMLPSAEAHSAPAQPLGGQFVSMTNHELAPILPRLEVAGRMMLYRFYAFVGRQKLGWGIRARIRAKFDSIFRVDSNRSGK